MSKCPFLKIIGICAAKKLQQSAGFFLKICPVMGRRLHAATYPGVDDMILGSENKPSNTGIAPKDEDSLFDYEQFAESKVAEKKNDSTYRIFKRINRMATEFPMAKSYDDGKIKSSQTKNQCEDSMYNSDVTVWCSNDYLGMSRHSHVIEKAIETVKKLGIGAGGTRNISGNSLYHEMLEAQLADWYDKPAGLLFTSCYVANVTSLFSLGQLLPGCVIFSDSGNHASMIEGIRCSRANKFIFRHNDPEHLELLLSQCDRNLPKIVAFESINSMTGSIAPIQRLCDIAHKYGALTFIDEVHAVGLYGRNGSGLGEEQNCLKHMDLISGTLGKAVGSMGGFLVGSENVIDLIRSYGSGFIFTTSLPPVLVQAASSAINILKSDEGRDLRRRHQAMASITRRELTRKGFPLFPSPSHIVPLHVGDARLCQQVSDKLLKNHGIYIQAINYPTVPCSTERLRLAPSPKHTEMHLKTLLECLSKVWQDSGLSFLHSGCYSNGCNCEHLCGNFSDIVLPECIAPPRKKPITVALAATACS